LAIHAADANNTAMVLSINLKNLLDPVFQDAHWDDMVKSSLVSLLKLEDINSYIENLRNRVRPFIILIENRENLKVAEAKSFATVYKGATDFITKYVYPLPVKMGVKLVCPGPITPNHITIVSMVLSFGAVPLFFLGWFWSALGAGIIMSVLDSIDGKLARLTFRTSNSGDLLDHVSDVVYLAMWYLGIGWFFADGNLWNGSSPIVISTWALLGFYLLDRIVTGGFKSIFKENLHDHQPFDAKARVFISRRNPFLLLLLIFLPFGQAVWALHGICLWTGLTLLFHTVRAVFIPIKGLKHQSAE